MTAKETAAKAEEGEFNWDESPRRCAQCAEDARDDSNLCQRCENRAFGIAEEEDYEGISDSDGRND